MTETGPPGFWPSPVRRRFVLTPGLHKAVVDFMRITRVVGGSVGLKAGSIIMTFITMILIARMLSADGVGVYALASLSATLGAIATAAGFEALAVKLGARTSTSHTQQRLRRIVAVFLIILPVSAALAASIIAVLLIGYGFAIDVMLAPVAIQATAMGAYRVIGAAMQARGGILISQIGELSLRPAFVLAATVALQAHGALTETGVLWAMAGGALACLIYILIIFLLTGRGARTSPRLLPSPKVVAGLSFRGPPYAGFFVIVLLLEQVDILLLGLLLGAAEAGLYQPASRVAWFAAFGGIAISIFARPQFAKAAAEKQPARIRSLMRLCRAAAIVYFAISSLFLILFSKQIFALFGDEYQNAGAIMIVLLAAHGLASVVGPVDAAAQVLGSGARILLRALLSLGVFIIAGLTLIPPFAGLGAAFAAFIGAAAYRLSFLLYVRQGLRALEKQTLTPTDAHGETG